MKNIERDLTNQRKSIKYQFPGVVLGEWGPDVREKHPDKLHEAILARIKHISSRLDSYLPPYEKNYGVDQSLMIDIENSFSKLADLYLELAKKGYGGYFHPLKENETYSFEPIKAFDKRLEEIHQLIIEAEAPFFEEREKGKHLSVEEKVLLHKKILFHTFATLL